MPPLKRQSSVDYLLPRLREHEDANEQAHKEMYGEASIKANGPSQDDDIPVQTTPQMPRIKSVDLGSGASDEGEWHRFSSTRPSGPQPLWKGKETPFASRDPAVEEWWNADFHHRKAQLLLWKNERTQQQTDKIFTENAPFAKVVPNPDFEWMPGLCNTYLPNRTPEQQQQHVQHIIAIFQAEVQKKTVLFAQRKTAQILAFQNYRNIQKAKPIDKDGNIYWRNHLQVANAVLYRAERDLRQARADLNEMQQFAPAEMMMRPAERNRSKSSGSLIEVEPAAVIAPVAVDEMPTNSAQANELQESTLLPPEPEVPALSSPLQHQPLHGNEAVERAIEAVRKTPLKQLLEDTGVSHRKFFSTTPGLKSPPTPTNFASTDQQYMLERSNDRVEINSASEAATGLKAVLVTRSSSGISAEESLRAIEQIRKPLQRRSSCVMS